MFGGSPAVSGASASPLYPSYTYDFWGEATPAPQAYLPTAILSGVQLGVGEFKTPQDLAVGGDGRIYVLDSGNRRIVVIDERLNVVGVIDQFVNDGVEDRFNNPQGIAVTTRETIVVADTDNARLVELRTDGTFVREIGPPLPEVGVLPADFSFRPRKVGVDPAGRIFVVAANVYEGLLEFDIDGAFAGFIGAARVAPNMWDYFWARISTREQRARLSLFLPTEFSNLDIDSRGFIYATTPGSSVQMTEAVKKLNPAGNDVLRRLGFHVPVGDIVYALRESGVSIAGPSVLVDVVARPEGLYSVLDQRRGRVFTYDSTGNLLYVFGGPQGNVHGTFGTPVAIEALGDKLLVLDSANAQVTIFEPTEYASLIHSAIEHYNAGRFDASTDEWRKVVRINGNYDLAYSGIGRALLWDGEYREAMTYLRLGKDRENYSKAFSYYRKQVIEEYFGAIFVAGLFVGGAFTLARRRKKARLGQSADRSQSGRPADSRPGSQVAATAEAPAPDSLLGSLRYALHVIVHPFDGFWDLKHEKRGNVLSASIILLLVVATYILMRQYTGFLFNYRKVSELNILIELGSVLVPFALWSAVNWAVTTLMDGKGTIKDIYIATAYSLTPLVLLLIPATLISNFLTLEEGAFFYYLQAAATLWTGLLLFLGTLVTHDYDIPKTVVATLVIVVGIGVVIFISMLLFSVINTLLAFVSTLWTEVQFRL